MNARVRTANASNFSTAKITFDLKAAKLIGLYNKYLSERYFLTSATTNGIDQAETT